MMETVIFYNILESMMETVIKNVQDLKCIKFKSSREIQQIRWHK